MAASVLDSINAAFAADRGSTGGGGADAHLEDVGGGARSRNQLPDGLDTFIERDMIARKRKQKTWKKLDRCDKWTCLSEYMRLHNVPADGREAAEIRSLLMSGRLDDAVEYDVSARRVTKLAVVSSGGPHVKIDGIM